MMGGTQETSSARPRVALFAIAVLIIGALATRPWLGHSEFDAKNDACLYVITARSLAMGEGYTYLGEPFTVRPPGFSLLIAPLIRVFGTDFGVLNLAVSLTGVLCLVLLFVFLRKRIGEGLAFLMAAGLWLNPSFQSSCNQVMSDVPGLALTLACLLLARRADERPSPLIDVCLGLAIGLSGLVRTAVVLLLPAVLGSRFLREAIGTRGVPRLGFWRGALIVTTATILAQLPWHVRNAGVTVPPIAEHTFMHSYGTAMLHVDPGDSTSPRITFADFIERVQERTPEVLATVGSRLARVKGKPVDLILGGVLILACIVQLVRKRRTSDFFAFGTTLVLCTYFAYRGRLAIPLYVLGLAAIVELAVELSKARFRARGAWIVAGVLLLVTIIDAGPARRRAAIAAEMNVVREVVDVLRARVAPDTPLAASPNGYLFEVFLADRHVFSMWPSIRRNGIPGAREFVAKRGIEVCVLGPTHRGLCGVFGCELVADVGPWRIVRFRR